MARLFVLAVVFGSLAGLAGCVGEGGPTRAPETPATARPGVLAITATDFMDTDGDKYRDLSTVVVYVFPESAQYALPIPAEGSFEFILETSERQLIRQWRFGLAETAAAMRQLAPGPGFVFDLSLLAQGQDELPIPDAELRAMFQPASPDVGPLHARTQSPLLVGSLGRSGGVP